MGFHSGFVTNLIICSRLSKFSQYHEGGFKFTARFDRCYLKRTALRLQHFGLIGNHPVSKEENGGVRDYLSDHFGLLVRIDVDAPVSNV
jgi:hypothetical protein